MRIQPFLSSANVFIEMPTGHPVGYITDLNISTSMNQQQIKNMRSEGIQSYVKGFTVNSISASRAIIDGETFFGNYQQILDYYGQVTNIIKSASDITSVISSDNPVVQMATNVIDTLYSTGILNGNSMDYREFLQSWEDLTTSKICLAEFWAKVPFSIVAKTSVPNTENLNFEINDILNTQHANARANIKELWRIDNCSLNSRSIKMSTNDVIIMENLELFSTSFSDSNFIAQLLNGNLR